MFVRVKRSMNKSPPLPARPPAWVLVIITRGFAAGLIGQVEAAVGNQANQTNKVPVRLCGPTERVWMINWRRLRLATGQESLRWGRETYAAHVARMNGGSNAVESKSGQGTHQEGRQV
jgi:hypothetical protein